ncbi:MCP methyltransferase, CheR-type [Desulfovibrio sp. X2]|uniref:CheR family methyltransferase n=1 Tax=Desulfovibrio sp. X2 TaxID=941449 RepID=UPI000358C4D9|nr:protein-glutamate O-methyltransferase [Desulfovibrio sp. X2]EPR44113.1 MCP methyltransferase, CheR-type [Desulfovibrio sp. X2]
MVTTASSAAEPGDSQSYRIGSMTERDFKRFSEFIHRECGIKMPPGKKTMLEARLQKRLRALELESYAQYCDYIFSPGGMETELIHMLDVVTTNTTDFFREPRHFDLLRDSVLPAWHGRFGNSREMRFWSAGCSTGEEPYTLAMVLSEYAAASSGFHFSVLATDISTRVLQHALRAVYSMDKVEPVPMPLKKKYLLRSKDKSKALVRIVGELRSKISFGRLNFMESFSFDQPMDVIFCRNVMIYFERSTQEELLTKFCANLRAGGHLFIGHSESLTGMNLPLRQIAPTVYEREKR